MGSILGRDGLLYSCSAILFLALLLEFQVDPYGLELLVPPVPLSLVVLLVVGVCVLWRWRRSAL